MDVRVKLIKGRDFHGLGIRVTRQSPIISVSRTKAAALVAGGFFAYCDTQPVAIAPIGKDLDSMDLAELKSYAASHGIDAAKIRSKQKLLGLLGTG